MRLGQRYHFMQFLVHLHRIALIGIHAQEQKFPKGIHPWQMLWPVHLRDVIEDIPDDFIGFYFIVKGIDEGLDVFRCGDVFFHFRWCWAYVCFCVSCFSDGEDYYIFGCQLSAISCQNLATSYQLPVDYGRLAA